MKQQKPQPGARLPDKILHPRRRHPAKHRTVAFEPGDERNDLVELGEAKPGQPSEAKQVDDRRYVRCQAPGRRRQGKPCGTDEERGKGSDAGKAVEFQLRPPPRVVDGKQVEQIETETGERRTQGQSKGDGGSRQIDH
ncbi:hypothetical protein D3C72_2062020 [compost metagenome]